MLRKRLDLTMNEVGERLADLDSWYANRQREGSSHHFTVADYYKTKVYLEIQYLRELADVSPDDLYNAIDDPQTHDQNDPPIDWENVGLNLKRYTQAKLFLVTLIANRDEELAKELVHDGIIEADTFNEAHQKLE
ncbi:hypothetical protein DVR14_21180 (plasmid) [Natrinema thermotolerans]|nr:hypothetical protein DVR14_17050 [Natrinema thermotolerans]QCC61158.1 hypothetical protein DVR14_21180 [Natrinema thermotolerans]